MHVFVSCVKAELVLERFLNEKSVEAKLILQTDEQLTEDEKRIQGKLDISLLIIHTK